MSTMNNAYNSYFEARTLPKKIVDYLFNNVEMPLIKVLAKMELNGIKCSKEIL